MSLLVVTFVARLNQGGEADGHAIRPLPRHRPADAAANRPDAGHQRLDGDGCYRRGDSVFLHFDLPGVEAESIEVTAEQNTLTVRAERRWTPESDDQVLAQERPQGMFMRQLMLGEHLDTQKVRAGYENGVLTIELPVAPEAKPRKIEVRASGQHRGAIDVEATSDE
jgi:HSP20 family protein